MVNGEWDKGTMEAGMEAAMEAGWRHRALPITIHQSLFTNPAVIDWVPRNEGFVQASP